MSKLIDFILKCLEEKKHLHMLCWENEEKRKFTITFVNKRWLHWNISHVSLFMDYHKFRHSDITGGGSNYAEYTKKCFKNGLRHLIVTKHLEYCGEKKLRKSVKKVGYRILPVSKPQLKIIGKEKEAGNCQNGELKIVHNYQIDRANETTNVVLNVNISNNKGLVNIILPPLQSDALNQHRNIQSDITKSYQKAHENGLVNIVFPPLPTVANEKQCKSSMQTDVKICNTNEEMQYVSDKNKKECPDPNLSAAVNKIITSLQRIIDNLSDDTSFATEDYLYVK